MAYIKSGMTAMSSGEFATNLILKENVIIVERLIDAEVAELLHMKPQVIIWERIFNVGYKQEVYS